MGLFGDLFSKHTERRKDSDRDRVLKHWGLTESEAETEAQADASHYDKVNWRKKLQRILDELPESEPEWADFIADAQALGFGEDWTHRILREEFTLLVRRAVADHVVTEAEHRKLDKAHEVLGLSNAEAESIYRKVVSEAEKFFGTHVEGS